ncbi:hypothetical protein ABZS81_27060 [Streptomyces sp. NPDC005318]|uniref:hypothetical protein n=1 Tax=unclassified Streptomyces TaxID=2593676 RepID=UPI002E2CB9A2|nr:hypothetical protein [Streptomyces sp. NBC_00316]
MARMGPRRLWTTVLGLGGGIYLIGASMLRADTQLTGTAGQFRAEHCEVAESRRGESNWTCRGPFEADDHTFRIAQVEVDTTFDKPPTSAVATRVDGPSSTAAVEDSASGWLLPGGTGLLCLGVASWNIRSAFRRPASASTAQTA